MPPVDLLDQALFSQVLYDKMCAINPGIEEMELYEFRYGLHNLTPEEGGWAGVRPSVRSRSRRAAADRIEPSAPT